MCLASAGPRGTGPTHTADGQSRRAHRSHWLLGLGDQRGLALPDDHAGQGRLSGRADDTRRHGRWLMPGIRRPIRPRACNASRTAPPMIMRVPGRLHITWQDEDTMRVETDAGMQARTFRFRAAAATPGERSWQGDSTAEWQTPRGGRGRAGGAPEPPKNGSLKVVTTNIRGGIPEEERRAVQRKRGHHRILLARAAARRSRDAGGDDGGRGSAVPHAAVHRQLAVQEAGRQRGLGSDALLGHVVAIMRSFTGVIVLASILAAAPASAQIELSGSWAARNHEDAMERAPGRTPSITPVSR